ncbi:hypothetical protein [Peptostreptococcus sp. D1]|uniref:hypothetical protein n=1 Tax=Peptostreptococcus sp. D1 TaxID=72304 RepID=UPI0008E8B9A2|nr:hypothetical protein [Peptostreptococcus sp. D1]SFE92700.1 hypothetical protein SAMN02910278_02093 [Peptostreptococcus sp. D1]
MAKSKIIWKTLKEIEQEYKISAASLRRYISEDRIGKHYLKREGAGKWYIKESYIKNKYERR